MPRPILLYDGICGLCNRFVQLILRRDRNAIFRFASLQSVLAVRILGRHSIHSSDLDTVYVVLNPDLTTVDTSAAGSDESLLSRSEAVLFVMKQLGGFWRPAASLLQLLPKLLRDSGYNAIARHRYRIFGRSAVCTLPRDQDRSCFLDS